MSDPDRSPIRFSEEIDRVIVAVSGEPFHNVAKEVENAFLKQ